MTFEAFVKTSPDGAKTEIIQRIVQDTGLNIQGIDVQVTAADEPKSTFADHNVAVVYLYILPAGAAETTGNVFSAPLIKPFTSIDIDFDDFVAAVNTVPVVMSNLPVQEATTTTAATTTTTTTISASYTYQYVGRG